MTPEKEKYIKIFSIALLLALFLIVRCSCKTDDAKPKTKSEIARVQKDSTLLVREKKIDFALSHLKDMIKKNMKNPDSYEMIARTWDKKDTTEIVKLLISFNGENSFGGKSKTTVLANYNLKDETIIITKEIQD
jgi:hypothetical protein